MTGLGRVLRSLTRSMVAATRVGQSDRELVERFLVERDEAIFEVLVRRHGPMVYRVCWRALRQAQDAEDAFQATFLVLARKLSTIRKLDSLASWLHGVAYRVALKAKSQAATRRRHEQQTAVSVTSPPDDMTWGELRTLLDAELALLPDKWRLPLILIYLEGRTQDEAAEHLSWSKTTFRRRLDEARAALGRRLARTGVVAPAAFAAFLLSDCVASAILPAPLISSTVDAVSSGASAQCMVPGTLTARVVALADGVGKTATGARLKMTLAVLLAVTLGTGVGSGALGPRSSERTGEFNPPSAGRAVAIPEATTASEAHRDVPAESGPTAASRLDETKQKLALPPWVFGVGLDTDQSERIDRFVQEFEDKRTAAKTRLVEATRSTKKVENQQNADAAERSFREEVAALQEDLQDRILAILTPEQQRNLPNRHPMPKKPQRLGFEALQKILAQLRLEGEQRDRIEQLLKEASEQRGSMRTRMEAALAAAAGKHEQEQVREALRTFRRESERQDDGLQQQVLQVLNEAQRKSFDDLQR